MPFTHYNLPTTPELTHKSQQKLVELDYNQTEYKTTTLYELVENTPNCPMCGKPLVKQGKVIKTYYDIPLGAKPNIIQVKRRLWFCCKKFQPTPLDGRILNIMPGTKFTPRAISYIQTRAYELAQLTNSIHFITQTIINEVGAKANAINAFLKPELAKLRKHQQQQKSSEDIEQDEYLALKNKRENSEEPLTKEERSRFKQLKAKLMSKYDF